MSTVALYNAVLIYPQRSEKLASTTNRLRPMTQPANRLRYPVVTSDFRYLRDLCVYSEVFLYEAKSIIVCSDYMHDSRVVAIAKQTKQST